MTEVLQLEASLKHWLLSSFNNSFLELNMLFIRSKFFICSFPFKSTGTPAIGFYQCVATGIFMAGVIIIGVNLEDWMGHELNHLKFVTTSPAYTQFIYAEESKLCFVCQRMER